MGVEYIPILRCGQCGEVGALDPVRLADGRTALQAFRELGWRSESPDDKHPEPWWGCPKCAAPTRLGGN